MSNNNNTAHDGGIFIGFLLLIIWLPLPLGSNRIWAWSIMEIWVYGLSVLWLLLYLFKRVHFTPVFYAARWVIALFFIWLCWIGLQLFPLPFHVVKFVSPQAAQMFSLVPGIEDQFVTLSVNPHATQTDWYKSLAYVLIFCLALLLLNRRKRIIQLAYVIIFSATFQAIYGTLMTLSRMEYGFFIKKEFFPGMATGTYVNTNHLACYLVMGLSVGIGLLIAKLDTGTGYTLKQILRNILKLFVSEKIILRAFLVFMVIALVLTHSRMGNMSFFIALLVAGSIGLIFSKYATRSTIILLASLIIFDLVIIGSWFGVEKIAKEVEEVKFVTDNRDEVFKYVVVQWSDYKLTGSGLGSFYSVFPAYRKSDVNNYYNHAHNDYLQFAAETGVIGILLLAACVLSSLFMALLAQYRRHDQTMRGMSFAAIMGITAMLMHATVDFNFQIPANAATFMLLLALAWVSCSLKINSNHKKRNHY